MTVDASDVYAKGSSDGYTNGYNAGYKQGYSDGDGYGSVSLGYNYDPDGDVDAVRAVCSRCGHSGWWWL